jgi:hypothetical protein
MIGLGYPPYFATILGTAKLLAAAALLTPGVPRLKEWAYAGILINMTGACASHLAAGDPLTTIIAPGTFAVTALTSWRLRPLADRRNAPASRVCTRPGCARRWPPVGVSCSPAPQTTQPR